MSVAHEMGGGKGMDDLRYREYNGWENRWTWLVHLHLSNEQAVFLEMAHLVASQPNDAAAGQRVERWVKSTITGWVHRLPGRDRSHDEQICLLTWDLLGAALAYTEWDDLVTLLTGGERTSNVFTLTLVQHIQQASQLRTHVEAVLRRASSLVAAADTLKAWCEAVLAEWIDKVALRRQGETPVTMLFSNLLENAYGLVCWEHVARAFRPGY